MDLFPQNLGLLYKKGDFPITISASYMIWFDLVIDQFSEQQISFSPLDVVVLSFLDGCYIKNSRILHRLSLKLPDNLKALIFRQVTKNRKSVVRLWMN